MITIETNVTGGQIAQDMMGDEEEFFYFLERMGEEASDRFIESMSEYADAPSAESITVFCQKIISALKEE